MKILRKESKENTGYSKNSNIYEECLWQAFDTPEERISELKCKLIDTFQLKCKMKKEWTTTENRTFRKCLTLAKDIIICTEKI